MCCGSKRQQVVTSAFTTSGSAATAAPSPSVSSRPVPVGMVFVYDGIAALSVIGAATGRRYRFDTRGARLTVDPRDVPMLAMTPKLRRLSPS